MSVPTAMELWDQANREAKTADERTRRYAELLEEHGHLVRNEPCPTCGERFRHRHTRAGAIIRVDIFGHDQVPNG